MALPPGVTARPIDIGSDADLAMAHAVIVGCEMEALGWTDETSESTRAMLTGPDAHPAAHLLACDGPDAVGLLAVELLEHARELFLDAFAIGPDAAPIQRHLLERGLEKAASLAHEHPAPGLSPEADPYVLSPDAWQVLAAAYAQDESYRSVLGGLGFRPIRRFWRMILDVTTVGSAEPAAPQGVTRSVVDGDADRRILHELFSTSFAEHFGSSHDEPFEDWIASMDAVPGVDPSRWWLVHLAGRPVGFCVLDDSKAEFGEGYVRVLGVLPEARGRGIATWLLACAAVDARSRGRTGLALAVDGENTTGATSLYQGVGFTTRQVLDVWCYPLLSASSR
jgi:ribosomal protein S18 acetylase RimI-like enzyme